MVDEVKSLAEFQTILNDNQLVACDFTAKWCGPCQMIGPKFVAMKDSFKHIKFIKVDVDECDDIAGQYEIRAMPTFKFFKNGKVTDELVGASEEKLRDKLQAL